MTQFEIFLNNIGTYPTIVFTGLVLFVCLFWLTSLVGLSDMDSFDIGEVDVDVDTGEVGFITGILIKFGLHGVPLLIILTAISLIGWLLSYFYSSFLNSKFPDGLMHYVFGTGALILVLVVSMWITGILLTPIRKNLEKMPKRDSKSFIGQKAVVRTLTVNQNHGEATLEDGGAGLILKIRSLDANTQFNKDDTVVLVEYVQDKNVYLVVSENEYLGQ